MGILGTKLLIFLCMMFIFFLIVRYTSFKHFTIRKICLEKLIKLEITNMGTCVLLLKKKTTTEKRY